MAGILVQWATVRPLGSNGSYIAQAVFSIELSYGLNRWLTWRDRDAPDSLLKWNVQRILLTVPNWAVFALLVHFGLPWLAANLAVTAVFTVINYATGDIWTFRQAAAPVDIAPDTSLPANWMPTVSIVIPCKGNQRTIAATAESLLAQDYPNLIELILVGDVGDSTWKRLTHITDPRLITLEHELEPGLRDPNVKRDKGLRRLTARCSPWPTPTSSWTLTGSAPQSRFCGAGLRPGRRRNAVDPRLVLGPVRRRQRPGGQDPAAA